jgi:hypothetical protein
MNWIKLTKLVLCVNDLINILVTSYHQQGCITLTIQHNVSKGNCFRLLVKAVCFRNVVSCVVYSVDDLKILIYISDVSQKLRYSASTVSKSNKHFSAVFRLPYQTSIWEMNDSYCPLSINKYARCSIFGSFHPFKTSTVPSLPVLIATFKRHKATALAV